MTTEREYREWNQKIRKIRGQRNSFKPLKSSNPVILVIIFFVSVGVLIALKPDGLNQPQYPVNNQKYLDNFEPSKL